MKAVGLGAFVERFASLDVPDSDAHLGPSLAALADHLVARRWTTLARSLQSAWRPMTGPFETGPGAAPEFASASAPLVF